MIPCNRRRREVREFRLVSVPILKENNPYYFYFQIASQNVKIRS